MIVKKEKFSLASCGRNIHQNSNLAEFHVQDTKKQRPREEQNTEDKDFKYSGAEKNNI